MTILMVKLFQSMTLTGTPWSSFNRWLQLRQACPKLQNPKRKFDESSRESIAELLLVPKTLPGLNLERASF